MYLNQTKDTPGYGFPFSKPCLWTTPNSVACPRDSSIFSESFCPISTSVPSFSLSLMSADR